MNTIIYERDGINLKITWLEVNPDYDKLKSDILINLYAQRSGTINTLGSVTTITASVAGISAYISNQQYVSLPPDFSWHKIGSCLVPKVSHTSNTASQLFKVTGKIAGKDINYAGYNSLSGMSKSNIQKTIKVFGISSTITLVPATLSAEKTAVIGNDASVTMRKSNNSQTLKLRYLFGSNSNEIDEFYDTVDNRINTEYTFPWNDTIGASHDKTVKVKLGLSNLSYCKNKESDQCVLLCYSYYDGSQVGMPTCTIINYSVPDTYKPSISNYAADLYSENETVSDWGIGVQGYSSLDVTGSIAHSDSNISYMQMSLNCAGNTLNSIVTKSSGAFPSLDEETPVINSFGQIAVGCVLTDSRGRTATATDSQTFERYAAPSIEIEYARRADSSGKIDSSGEHLDIKVNHSQSFCAGNNEISISFGYKQMSASTYTGLTDDATHSITDTAYSKLFNTITLDNRNAYMIKATITDALGNSKFVEARLLGQKVLLHLKPGGDGIGLGQYNFVSETVKIGYDLYVKEDLIDDYIEDLFGDYVVKRGTAVSNCINASNNNASLGQIMWQYEKYHSGKIEMYGTLPQVTLTLASRSDYAYIYSTQPQSDNTDIIPSGGMLVLNGAADSICRIDKGSTNGRNGGYFCFLLSCGYEFNSVNVKMEFRITYIPTGG